MSILRDSYQLIQGGGNVIAIAVAEATQAVKVGTIYILSTNADCFIRFSSTAVTAADGGHDLFMPLGSTAILMCTDTTLRVIRAVTDGTLGVAEVEIT